MEIDTNHDDGSPGSYPAQAIVRGLARANAVKDHIVTAKQHPITQHASVELAARLLFDALVIVGPVKDMRGSHARGLFNLKAVTGHDGYLSLGSKRADHLERQQATSTRADD